MAGTSTRKFIYDIAAEYSGESAIQRLKKDLQTLDNIELFTKSRASLAKLREEIKQQRSVVESLENAWKKSGKGAGTPEKEAYDAAKKTLDGYLNSRKKLLDDLAKSRKALQSEGQAARDVAARYKELDAATRQRGRMIQARQVLGITDHKDIANQVNQVKEAYRRLKAEGNLTWKEQMQASLHMTTRIQALKEQTNGWGTQLLNLRNAWAKLAGVFGGIRIFAGAVRTFGEFQSAMLQVKAVSGASAEEMEALKQKAQELGASTRYSAAEVAQAMKQLAAAGQTAEQVGKNIGAALDIAAISGMDVGMAADQLTNIMSQFGIAAEHSEQVADVLASGFTGAATSLDQLAEAMSYVGPQANAVGYSLTDTTAVLMSLANGGIKASRAGTALFAAIRELQAPTGAAADILKKYDINVMNADGSMRDFADIIDEFSKKGVQAAEVIQIFGSRAAPGMQVLLSQGAQAIRDYQERLKGAGGTARKTAEEIESGIEGSMRRLQAAWEAFKIAFGDAALAKYVQGATEWLAKLTAAISEMPKWGHQLLGLASVMGIVGAAWGSLALAFKALGVITAPFVGAIKAAFAPLETLNGRFIAVAHNIGVLEGKAALLKFVFRSINSAALAAFGGWIVGNWLNQFDIVRKAGVALAAGLHKAFLYVKESMAWWKGGYEAADAVRREIEQVDKIYGEMFADIERGTDEYRQKQKKAAEDQKKDMSAVTDAAKKNNAAQVQDNEEALKEMAQAYKKHVDEVKRLQEEISGRQKSLTAELRDMARGGMNDADAWVDQRNAAQEYIKLAKQAADEARRAQASGDTITAGQRWKEAVQYADDAKAAYKALNHEVKSGDQVIISSQTALKGAMRGVKEAGELAIDFLKEQEKAATDAAQALEKQHGFEALTKDMDAAERKWAESMRKIGDSAADAAKQVYNVWENAAGFFTNVDDEFSAGWSKTTDVMSKGFQTAMKQMEVEAAAAARQIDREFDKAFKSRTFTITMQAKERARWGGLIGAAEHFARGGKLAGYGGGDRISALLEAGEFVVRKEAVRKFGAGFFHALNNLRLPELPDLSALLPQPAAALPGGGHMVLELKLPGGETVAATVSGDDAERLARFNRRVSNTRFRR